MKVKENTKLINHLGGHKRPAFVYALLSLGTVLLEHHVAALRLANPINCKMDMLTVKGEEVGVARNYVCSQVLRMNPLPEFIFFFSDDTIPEWWHLVKLYEEAVQGNWDVLGALYYMKQDEVPTPVLWREDMNGGLIEGIHYKLGEVVLSDIVGMDFALIRPEILMKMSSPWFKTGPTYIPESPDKFWYHTEDSFFCRRAKYEANAKMGVHTEIRCAHMNGLTGEIY